ncbi:unnamed protein product [Amoebophrya sp. A120]|nr:unnamed protein product [Amoebophrya sp. A120]|eukprot:GSA120T00004908001.1
MGKHTGVVAKWLNHKGIGFITPDDSADGGDVLVHFGSIKQGDGDGFKSLEEGSKVEFDLDDDPKNPGEKKVAINVTGPGGADCEPKTRKGKGKGDDEE